MRCRSSRPRSSPGTGLLRIVRITLAPEAASVAVSRTSTPSSARGSAFSRERFQARTSIPAFAMWRANGRPIVPPAPRTATVPVSVTPGSYPSGLIGEREQLARFPTHVAGRAGLDGQLRLDVAQELAWHPGDFTEVVERLEALLALAVGDQAGGLGDREADVAKLFEGGLVEVDPVAVLGRRRNLGLGLLPLLLRLRSTAAQDRSDGAAQDPSALLGPLPPGLHLCFFPFGLFLLL